MTPRDEQQVEHWRYHLPAYGGRRAEPDALYAGRQVAQALRYDFAARRHDAIAVHMQIVHAGTWVASGESPRPAAEVYWSPRTRSGGTAQGLVATALEIGVC